MIDIKDMDEHIVHNLFIAEITALQKALHPLSGSVLGCWAFQALGSLSEKTCPMPVLLK